jgi:hypothetical protein
LFLGGLRNALSDAGSAHTRARKGWYFPSAIRRSAWPESPERLPADLKAILNDGNQLHPMHGSLGHGHAELGQIAARASRRRLLRGSGRAEQLAQLAQIVEAGPDREKDGVVRWRRIDLKRVIAERFGVDFHPRYVGKLLQKLGFSHISARPRHPA